MLKRKLFFFLHKETRPFRQHPSLYEAIQPGHPGYRTLAGQLNGMPVLPAPAKGSTYYWPASANAALAAMNRFFYPTTSAANKAAIDALEATYNVQ